MDVYWPYIGTTHLVSNDDLAHLEFPEAENLYRKRRILIYTYFATASSP